MEAVARAGVDILDVRQTSSVFRELLLAAKRVGCKIDFDIPEGGRSLPPPPLPSSSSPPSGPAAVDSPCGDEGAGGEKEEGRKARAASAPSTGLAPGAAVPRLTPGVTPTNYVLTLLSAEAFRSALYTFGKSQGVDVALQTESVLRRSKRLVVMDMDSTLIQQEVIDELARHAGVYEAVRDITHAAMGGGLDFNESLRQRVALLAGTPATAFRHVIDNLVYTDGAHELCRSLKKLGYRLAVISGGFTAITEHVRKELGLHYDYANQLEVGADGCFTGRTVGPVVNAQRKADLLMTIAQQERISLNQVIAVGDGANDLPMLAVAGLGIAFNAKPAVQAAASFRINQRSLGAVLYLLGFSEDDQLELSGRPRPGGGEGAPPPGGPS
ncbi:hypothetical protein I4F81_011810 [Pyropia yezoensis]|uniref:Uncharacterized protein n=1 Tax=Pyropia yezoensis TaxID=2788 RepID=A0ACC3CGK2_PYRYE|nr:hypothetical protein I4F81_011810 [Neopyropia yezoensis]